MTSPLHTHRAPDFRGQGTGMNAIRIEDIRRSTLNGRAVKLFKAYRLQGDAYVFAGQFAAPARTSNKTLHTFAL